MACWLRIPCGHCYGLGFIPGPGIFTLPHAVGAAKKKKKKKKKEEMLELKRWAGVDKGRSWNEECQAEGTKA